MNRIDAQVLLLGANFVPVAIVSARAAVNLLMAEKVDPIDGIATVLRSVNKEFEIPSVIRLRTFHYAPSRKATWSRRAVLRRDGFRCVYCGVRIGDEEKGKVLAAEDFTVDHIVPSSRGGKSSWVNCACSCFRCNHRKGSHTPNEAGMKLLWEPKRPRVTMWVASGEIPKEWKIYVES